MTVRLVPNDQAAEKDAPLIWALLPEEMRKGGGFNNDITVFATMLMSEGRNVFAVTDPITAFCWMSWHPLPNHLSGMLFPETAGEKNFAELFVFAWREAVRRGYVTAGGTMIGSTTRRTARNFVVSKLGGEEVSANGEFVVKIADPIAKLDSFIRTQP